MTGPRLALRPPAAQVRLVLSNVLTGSVVAGLGALLYVLWLGWHTPYYPQSPGSTIYVGPYHPRQVVGLGLCWAILTAAGALVRPVAAALGACVGVVAIYSVDQASRTDTIGANLWFLGSFAVLGASAGAATCIALLVHLKNFSR